MLGALPVVPAVAMLRRGLRFLDVLPELLRSFCCRPSAVTTSSHEAERPATSFIVPRQPLLGRSLCTTFISSVSTITPVVRCLLFFFCFGRLLQRLGRVCPRHRWL